MAMAALEALALSSSFSVSLPSVYHYPCSFFSNSNSNSKPFPSISNSIKLYSLSHSTPSPSLIFPFSPLIQTRKLCSAVQEASVEEEEEEGRETQPKRHLFVFNLQKSLSAEDIEKVFAECGTVETVKVPTKKRKDNVERVKKNNGYAFVTMASEDEALAVIQKFDNQEVLGKAIRIQFLRKSGKPRNKVYQLYVANLSRKVKKNDLKEIFSTGFSPLRAKVILPDGSNTGFGFVGFATKEEAEAALSALNGKDLMGRALRLELGFRNKNASDQSTSTNIREDTWESQPNES